MLPDTLVNRRATTILPREGGLRRKYKFFCLKNASIGWRAEQGSWTQAYHRRWAIFFFSRKNSHYNNSIWITFRAFLKHFERIKMLKFGSRLKNQISQPIQPLLYLQVKYKTRLNACILGLNFLIDLFRGGAEALLASRVAPLYAL